MAVSPAPARKKDIAMYIGLGALLIILILVMVLA